jgi:DNA-binding response OmpR family regulator
MFVLRQALILSGMIPLPSSWFSLPSLWPAFGKAMLAGADHAASEPKRRIMVVDDERDISMLFKSGLERNGFSVESFNDPELALSRFKPCYYDIVLLDIRMPKMNGFELCNEIRKQDSKVKVFFVFTFEIPEEEIRRYLPELDEKCILKKPVLMRNLVMAINGELSREAS